MKQHGGVYTGMASRRCGEVSARSTVIRKHEEKERGTGRETDGGMNGRIKRAWGIRQFSLI